jgi:hypothetical protein
MNIWDEAMRHRISVYYEHYGERPDFLPVSELEFEALQKEVKDTCTVYCDAKREETVQLRKNGLPQVHLFEGGGMKSTESSSVFKSGGNK